MKDEYFAQCSNFLEELIRESSEKKEFLSAYMELIKLKSDYDKATDKALIEQEIRKLEIQMQYDSTVHTNNTNYNIAMNQNNKDLNATIHTNNTNHSMESNKNNMDFNATMHTNNTNLNMAMNQNSAENYRHYNEQVHGTINTGINNGLFNVPTL